MILQAVLMGMEFYKTIDELVKNLLLTLPSYNIPYQGT